MRNTEQERLRLEIAGVLDAIVAHTGWSDNLWLQFHVLLERAEVDGILAHADEELTHYSGQFNARNLLLFRVKPDKDQVTGYKDEFQQLAAAIRAGTTWDEYKRANCILETADLSAALKKALKRVGRLMKRHK